MISQSPSGPSTLAPMSILTRREAEAVEAQAANSTLRADRRFLWLWLTISTALSVCGNIGHAALTVPPGTAQALAIAWAAAPPTLLMLAVHGLPTLSRMMGSQTTDKLLSIVVWGVVAVTFGWSAFGIYGFTTALGIPASLGWVAPLGIDLSVFGATRGLVLTSPLVARLKVGAPTQRAASPQLSKVPVPPAAPRQVTPTATPAAPPAPRTPTPAAPATPRTASPSAQQEPSDAASPDPELVALASRIVSSKVVRQDVRTVARILTLSETETRKAVIERELGIHHSVVTKVLEAAEAQRRHGLVAVS